MLSMELLEARISQGEAVASRFPQGPFWCLVLWSLKAWLWLLFEILRMSDSYLAHTTQNNILTLNSWWVLMSIDESWIYNDYQVIHAHTMIKTIIKTLRIHIISAREYQTPSLYYTHACVTYTAGCFVAVAGSIQWSEFSDSSQFIS